MAGVGLPGTVPPGERIWVRHRTNGYTGWLIHKGGELKVKLDREDPYAIKPYDPKHWERMIEVTSLPRQQVAMVQWCADRQLLKALGDHKRSKVDWHRVSVPDRVKFMDEGPFDGGNLEVRKAVWNGIRDATRSLVEGSSEAGEG